MEELWQVFFEFKLAKKKGKQNVVDKDQIKTFMQDNGLTHVLVDGESNKQPTMRVGLAKNNPSAAEQWRSEKSCLSLFVMLLRNSAPTQKNVSNLKTRQQGKKKGQQVHC
jgi:hypothetical protein